MTPAELAQLIQAGKIRLVVFDFDGTIYESSAGIEMQLRPLIVTQAAKTLGLSNDEARSLLRTYREQYRSSILGLVKHHDVDPYEYYDAVYDALDLSRMVARPGLSTELTGLSASVPLMIFTNSNRKFTMRALAKLGLTDPVNPFSIVRTVEDHMFIRKPQVDAYENMYAAVELQPREVAMFDDTASSLEVMNRLGSKTILVSNGLREAPNFVDLHTDIEYSGAPDFVDAATHDIVGYIRDVNKALRA